MDRSLQTSQLGRAFELAAFYHSAQKDKLGEPYLLHLVRVCIAVNSDTAKTVALLHDIVEDGHLKLADIDRDFSEYVAAAVDAITKRDGEEYVDYLSRVKTNEIALAVKLADIADNCDEARLVQLDELTAARLRKKYAHALDLLRG